MRAAEGFVRVEVHQVGPEIARPRDAQYRVHVGPVQVHQSARLVYHAGDALDLRLEPSQRVRIGDHEHGHLIVEPGGQFLDVDEALGGAFHRHNFEAGHRGAGRVGAVGGIGNQHDRPILLAITKIGGGHQQRRHLAVRPGGRLERDGRQSGDFGQVVLRQVQDGQYALERRLRLVGVQIGQARQRRQPLVPLGIVLHRTGAQRIKMRVDRHVLGRKVDEVPHHVRLGKFRQRQRGVAHRPFRQQILQRFLRHVAFRHPHRGSPAWKAQIRVEWIGCYAWLLMCMSPSFPSERNGRHSTFAKHESPSLRDITRKRSQPGWGLVHFSAGNRVWRKKR